MKNLKDLKRAFTQVTGMSATAQNARSICPCKLNASTKLFWETVLSEITETSQEHVSETTELIEINLSETTETTQEHVVVITEIPQEHVSETTELIEIHLERIEPKQEYVVEITEIPSNTTYAHPLILLLVCVIVPMVIALKLSIIATVETLRLFRACVKLLRKSSVLSRMTIG